MSRRAVPLLLALALATQAAAAAPRDRADYEVILDKAPFGPPPPTAGAAAAAPGATSETAGGAAAPAPDPGPPPPAPVRLSSVGRYGGVASAGLVEISSGRAFVLRPGEGWGPYRLVDALPDDGAIVVAQGADEWLVTLSWAKGQPTNLVPSARAPYLTTFRPGERGEAAGEAAPAEAAETAAEAAALASAAPAEAAAPARRPRKTSAGLTEEEEAELVRRATVTDADGSTHLSFRELNRLRAETLRRKAEEARAEALAAAEALRAERAREAAERRAAEEEAAAEKAEAEKARRAAVVAALAQGYDVEVDFELTADEAAQLAEAGFEVPEEDAE